MNDAPVYQEPYYRRQRASITERARLHTPHWLIPLVVVALLFLSLYVVTHRQLSEGETVLIAVLTGGVIAAGLMPKRKYQTTGRIYVQRIGPFVHRFYGDEETDALVQSDPWKDDQLFEGG